MKTRILDARGNPVARDGPPTPIRGRYDAAQTNKDNARHWAEADNLSARTANSPDVRSRLRNRSRYEAANNSYASGICSTLANDLVGTGPRLQVDSEGDGAQIEADFNEWADKVRLSEKLRTMRRARAVDGEAFATLVQNPSLRTRSKLDVTLIEADQVATPSPDPLNRAAVDGIELDRFGNPIAYHVLRVHPGDGSGAYWGSEYDRVPAEAVIHWFRPDRPGQFRGVPELTPALNLFAQLRRFTLAVLAAAETAADFAAVLSSDLPPDSEPAPATPFDSLDIEKRMLTTLPAGWKMSQFRAEQPATTYEMFKRELLNEIARCLNMPYNVAAGNSSSYNYSSGRLDNQTYGRTIKVDRAQAECVILDVLLAEWLDEAYPGAVRNWRWLWPGSEHVDPEKEANAQEIRLRNLMTTFSDECRQMGVDPEAQARTIAEDLARFERYKIPVPKAWGAVPAQPDQPTQPEDGAPPNADQATQDAEGREAGLALRTLAHRNGHA